MSENEKQENPLNPRIRTVDIGVRNLRIVKLYPLSLADQGRMAEIISSALKGFYEPGDGVAGSSDTEGSESDLKFVNFAVELITKNLMLILNLITDESPDYSPTEKLLRAVGKALNIKALLRYHERSLLDDMTAEQGVDVAHAIFEMNYEAAFSKVLSLLKKVQKGNPSLLGRLSQQFAPDMDTN